MKYVAKVRSDLSYYINYEPPDPKEMDVVAYEDDNYIRAYIFMKGQWLDIIDVSDNEADERFIDITYTSDDIPEDIESMDYLYRIGGDL